MMTNTNKQLTPAALRRWARRNRPLAEAVALATAFAQTERERVDAYIHPIVAQFDIRDEETGERILDTAKIYLADLDSDEVAAYNAACARAHRAHGFDGPDGYCPALIAEDLQRQAERALIEALGEFAGFEGTPSSMKLYNQALDLAMTACLGKVR